jgi:hypothetical protein
MPKLLPPGAEEVILYLSKKKMSRSMILKELVKINCKVSEMTITNVINGKGLKRSAQRTGQVLGKRKNKRTVRTERLIQNVAKKIDTPNPLSQRNIAKSLHTSFSSINRVIHNDLGEKTCRKTKVHALNAIHKANRKTNCRRLYEQHLAGGKSEYMVTLDEAWLYLDYCNGQRKICYINSGEQPPENWLRYCKERWPKGFMIVGAVSGRGVLPLKKVPSNVKINAENYIKYVLRPILEIEVPKIYPNELNKVFFHHDKASAHTSSKTYHYLEGLKNKMKINYIDKQQIPVKSPDAYLCDFFAFGVLKQRLFNRNAKTLNGLWKVSKSVWNQISFDEVQRAMKDWKRRCRLIASRDGAHIEHVKNLHYKKVLY